MKKCRLLEDFGTVNYNWGTRNYFGEKRGNPSPGGASKIMKLSDTRRKNEN